jgi:hypothetical protein
MVRATVADHSASDLKEPGPILDAATRGIVRIRRGGDVFLLLRQPECDTLTNGAATRRPESLAELLADYDAADVKRRLAGHALF